MFRLIGPIRGFVIFAIPRDAGYTDIQSLARALLRDRYDLRAAEVDVLSLLGQGCGNREIMNKLELSSERAAGNLVQSMLDSLNVGTRASACAKASRFGLFGGHTQILINPDENTD